MLGTLPLMAWTIKEAVASGVFDAVIAVVADEQYAAMAEKYGAWVPFRRPDYTVLDGSPDVEWVLWTLGRLREEFNRYDAFSILRVTSPFRTAVHIREAWNKFRNAFGADSLRTVRPVNEHPGKMWVIRQDRLLPLLSMGPPGDPENPPWHSQPTQELFTCYIQTAGMEFGWSDRVLKTKTIAGSTVVPYVVDGPAALDINTFDDWDEAVALVDGGTVGMSGSLR